MSAPLGIDHVQLAMPEGGEDRARAFYTDLLGMRELAKPSNLSPAGCWFECGALQLHLGVDSDFRPARKAHPALLVADLAEFRAGLAQAGAIVREDKPMAGYHRCFTEDPFGNRIELMQKL